MDTLIAKLRVAAAGWSPKVKPFDHGVATKIRLLARDMADAERRATTAPVRTGVHESTVAFTSLAGR